MYTRCVVRNFYTQQFEKENFPFDNEVPMFTLIPLPLILFGKKQSIKRKRAKGYNYGTVSQS